LKNQNIYFLDFLIIKNNFQKENFHSTAFALSYSQTPYLVKVQKRKLTKVSELLSKNECRRKIGQMTQITVTNFEEKGKPGVFDMVKLREAIQNYHGSILNVNPALHSKWKEVITTINTEANKTRLKIPVLYGIDVPKGYTSYTLQLGMAATFNTELVKRS
jgi:beta-glucosidase